MGVDVPRDLNLMARASCKKKEEPFSSYIRLSGSDHRRWRLILENFYFFFFFFQFLLFFSFLGLVHDIEEYRDWICTLTRITLT